MVKLEMRSSTMSINLNIHDLINKTKSLKNIIQRKKIQYVTSKCTIVHSLIIKNQDYDKYFRDHYL